MAFVIGDYLAGALIGALTALGVRAAVYPGMDMVIAMMLGMGIGFIIHVVAGLMLAPLLGMFEIMVPASLIAMYGGMLFAMRDSMAAGSRALGSALLVGAGFGLAVVVGVKLYDRALRGPVLDAE